MTTMTPNQYLLGLPPRPGHMPDPVEGARLLTAMKASAEANGIKFYDTLADLIAANLDDGVGASVDADTTVANNGLYQMVAGAPVRKGPPIGSAFVWGVDDDQSPSTANAYSIETAPRFVGEGQLVYFVAPQTSTSKDVSVSFDGGPSYAIKRTSLSKPAVGGLVQGMPISGFVSGNDFIMFSDQATASMLAQMEAALVQIEAAKAAVLANLIRYPTIEAIVADNALSYSAGVGKIEVAEGDEIFTARGGRYIIAASDAVGPQYFVTAGGVKLDHELGPYIIVITGQSNARGTNSDGPRYDSPFVKVWDGEALNFGSSDFTKLPWTRTNSHGNGGNNNYALGHAKRLIDDNTGRMVLIAYNAVSGRSIDDWVANGVLSERYAAIKTSVENVLAACGRTTIDELIWAQGEEDFVDTFETHLANLVLLRNQFRAETWCEFFTPIYMMGPSPLHDRYSWQNAMQYFCGKVDNRCIFVPSNGLRTEYQADGITNVPGSGDFTHFKGESLFFQGYYGIAAAAAVETSPMLFYGRGTGVATPADPTVLATFSSLVSFDSWTSTTNPNGPAATGSISWGEQCNADGNYSFALGYTCATDNSCNYTTVGGRDVLANASGDYSFGWGYQINVNATYAAGFGRGHTLADSGATAVGTFSAYTTTQTDIAVFQVGIGSSSSARENAFTVRKSGILEQLTTTVSALPAAGMAGRKAFVTDASVTAAGNFGTVVAGGGANDVPVYDDGSDWRIG